MLHLLFKLGKDRYLLNTSQITEVVPLVKLKKIPRSPVHVAGLMNYRGVIVPVVDLCALTMEKPCASKQSTRIIIVSYSFSENDQKLLGIIAEQVTETKNVTAHQFSSGGILLEDTEDKDNDGEESDDMVQLFDLQRMVPKSEIEYLYQE